MNSLNQPESVGRVMVIRTECPRCGEADYKKNGQTHYGKQNYQCRRCGREFVMELDRKPVSEEKEEYVRKLLLERISLRGICRAVGMSLNWLLSYLVNLYEDLPEHLGTGFVELHIKAFYQTIS